MFAKARTSDFFDLDGKLPRGISFSLGIIGGIFFIVIWKLAGDVHLLKNGVVGTPLGVAKAIPAILGNATTLGDVLYSITLNLLGYIEAAAIGLPLGLLIALQPWCRGLAGGYVSALRYLPLSAMIAPFMLAFGIATNMKVQFLAFGLLIYVVPQVIQRKNEVEKVYINTMKTMGASKWQMIRWVYLPAIISMVFGDFVVLSAISWTYIIIAEVVNLHDGGIGAMAYRFYRDSRTDEMYGAIAIILLIGVAFDRIGKGIDRWMFAWKYVNKGEQA